MMMHHSPMLHFVGKAAWLITALAAIHMGLGYFNVNLLSSPSLMKFVPYINLAVGVAGVLSLIMLAMCCMHKDHCDTKAGHHNKHQ
jgi:hypothetical protein